MKNLKHKLKEMVWIYKGDSPWHFVTITKDYADEIKKDYIWPRKGFGSIPINVTIGKTTWKTSIFPDKEGSYLVPLKKEIRLKENIKVGDTIIFFIEVIN